VETRTLVALAVLLLFAAKAHATSAVETARALERGAESTPPTVVSPSLPESPVAIVGPLAMREPLRIQLDRTEPAQRDDALLELSLDVSSQ